MKGKSYTVEEKRLLVFGYLLGLARAAKDEGLFPDLSVKEIASVYLQEYLTGNKKEG